ncbi:glycosyltransferase, partial [Mycobacterium sp. IS-836]|uniref:glycosyltransferase n=1 Tax=Mycobacterium sp. IS-836 TaxID=1834160 RepID=UPI0018E99EB3
MRFVLAIYGTRGDAEPGVAVGRELLRRGHDVHVAVAYGPDTREWWSSHRDFWTRVFRKFWKIRDLVRSWRDIGQSVTRHWEQITATLRSLAAGSDLLVTFLNFEQPAANVAEYYDIPLAT